MSQHPKTFTIQIQAADGAICGTGFLLDGRTAVTCAHVIETARARPGDTLPVMFAATGDPGTATVSTDGWSPVDENDITILHLSAPAPAEAPPAICWHGGDPAGHAFRAFGYAPLNNFAESGADGRMIELITDESGFKAWQLDSKQIDRGMSGAALLDTTTDRVVGMVSATWKTRTGFKHRDTAFATPLSAIVALVPALNLTPPPPSESHAEAGIPLSIPLLSRNNITAECVSNKEVAYQLNEWKIVHASVQEFLLGALSLENQIRLLAYERTQNRAIEAENVWHQFCEKKAATIRKTFKNLSLTDPLLNELKSMLHGENYIIYLIEQFIEDSSIENHRRLQSSFYSLKDILVELLRITDHNIVIISEELMSRY